MDKKRSAFNRFAVGLALLLAGCAGTPPAPPSTPSAVDQVNDALRDCALFGTSLSCPP